MKKQLLLIYLFLLTGTICSQAQHRITGKVTDSSNNETLVGATVLIKGTTTGASTNIDGSFELLYTNELPVTLVISFLGFESKEIVIANDTPVKINLSSLKYIL